MLGGLRNAENRGVSRRASACKRTRTQTRARAFARACTPRARTRACRCTFTGTFTCTHAPEHAQAHAHAPCAVRPTRVQSDCLVACGRSPFPRHSGPCALIGDRRQVHMITHCIPLEERNRRLMEDGLDIDELQNLSLVHYYGNTSVRRKLEVLPIESYSSCMIFADEAREELVWPSLRRCVSSAFSDVCSQRSHVARSRHQLVSCGCAWARWLCCPRARFAWWWAELFAGFAKCRLCLTPGNA